jgi:hypothetical protein
MSYEFHMPLLVFKAGKAKKMTKSRNPLKE